MPNHTKVQTSESLILAALLALAGGFMDAYSYLCRGEVFANAETGNIVLLALNFAAANRQGIRRYLLPVLAFALGVIITEFLRSKKESTQAYVHWRQISLLLEIGVLTAAAFMPQSMNLIVNSMISLTCGTQVATFAKFHGIAAATTMCTGNLRSGTQSLFEYLRFGRKNGSQSGLRLAGLHYGCIAMFIFGAMLGSKLSSLMGEKSILAAAGLLLLALILMFSEESQH